MFSIDDAEVNDARRLVDDRTGGQPVRNGIEPASETMSDTIKHSIQNENTVDVPDNIQLVDRNPAAALKTPMDILLGKYRGDRGELAPHAFLLTWLLINDGDDVIM